MNDAYYDNARKWYNTMYVDCASERFSYLLILVLACLCFWRTFIIIDSVKASKAAVEHYVIFVDHKDKKNTYIKVTPMQDTKDQSLGVLRLMIERYVMNHESFKYEAKKQQPMDAMRLKASIVKNLSTTDVFDKYMHDASTDEDGDLSLSLLKLQRETKIEKIEFIYEKLNIYERIYASISGSKTPIGAKVYVTNSVNSQLYPEKHLIVTMFFNYHIDAKKRANTRVEFKINDYVKEENENWIAPQEEQGGNEE